MITEAVCGAAPMVCAQTQQFVEGLPVVRGWVLMFPITMMGVYLNMLVGYTLARSLKAVFRFDLLTAFCCVMLLPVSLFFCAQESAGSVIVRLFVFLVMLLAPKREQISRSSLVLFIVWLSLALHMLEPSVLESIAFELLIVAAVILIIRTMTVSPTLIFITFIVVGVLYLLKPELIDQIIITIVDHVRQTLHLGL